MSCVFPIDAWRANKRSDNGKLGIVFNLREADVQQPVSVPCGRCIGCRADQARIWSVRMYHEASLHERNCFVTLTYADPPPSSLSKIDLQLFFKRLRRKCKFRYFACGEYGTLTRRPHYHAVIFGQDFLGGAYTINDSLHGNPYVDIAWNKGLVSIGAVSMASCAYVAGYCNKKLGDTDTFNLMSRRPGIGHAWLDRYFDDIRRAGHVVIEGQMFPIPKKYLEWYSDEFSVLIDERRNMARSADYIENRNQLRPREAMYKSRLSLQEEQI